MAQKTVILVGYSARYDPTAITSLKITCSPLADLFEALTTVRPANTSAVITEAAIDSRQVIPGSLFVAIPGEKVMDMIIIDRCIQEGGVFCFNPTGRRRLLPDP
jgi:UDP-N-acetylmuramyl pentapeptide synthase